MGDPHLSKQRKLVKMPDSVIKVMECVVVLCYFMAGMSWVYDALPPHNNHAHGARGTLLLLSMIWCALLLWKRRGESRNSLVWIMFVYSLSDSVEKGMIWMADGIHRPLSVLSFVLTIVFFTLLVFDTWTGRKKPEIEHDYESARFEPEDKR